MSDSIRDSFARLLRKNKRLKRELSRIETLFNAMKSAVLVADRAGQIQFANNYACEIFGIENPLPNIRKILPGVDKTLEELDSEDDFFSRREFKIDYPQERILGAQIVPFNFNEEGGATYAFIINDLTEDKHMAEERIENEKMDSLLALASGVAHEIGNPLNSINIHLQLARRRLAKVSESLSESSSEIAEIGDSINVCSEEVMRLNSIVENFLKALRPMRPDIKECDPMKPLAETLKILNGELENLKISVVVDVETLLPNVLADANMLKQLYFNLIRNSMEAMSVGGLIKISAKATDTDVRISFADNGCGIDEDGMAKLFKPYHTTKPNGHGLGMTIMRGIVRAHHGTIDVRSKPGRGTTISISIPRSNPQLKRLS